MKRRALFAFLLGLGVLVACQEDEKRPPNLTDLGNDPSTGGGGGGSSGTDGGTSIDASSGGTTDADATAECSALDDPTSAVEQDAVSSDTPQGDTGGTIIDGVYDLTIAEKYVGISGQAGPTGITYREVIKIVGGASLERVRLTQQSNGAVQTTNASYVLQVLSPNLTLTLKCPTVGVGEQYRYTFQNGKLTLVSGAGESFTYIAR